VILPAAKDTAQTTFAKKCTLQLCNIPLSNNTVSRRISGISEDLEEQLIEKLIKQRFSIQTEEVTDCSGIVT
jgi:hypothetical protein